MHLVRGRHIWWRRDMHELSGRMVVACRQHALDCVHSLCRWRIFDRRLDVHGLRGWNVLG